MEEKRRVRRKEKNEYFFDYSLLFLLLFLLGFGLIMIYSASSYEAFQEYQDAAHYLKKQLVAICVGLVGMIIATKIPIGFWRYVAYASYVVAIILILLVKTPLGVSSHGATRWIGIPGTGFNLQPAEVAKIAVILVCALLLSNMKENVKKWGAWIFMMIVPLPLAALIYFVTNNLSSAIIVVAIGWVMIFISSPTFMRYVVMGASALSAAAVIILYVVQKAQEPLQEGETQNFRFGRILAWLDPEAASRDQGFQTVQGLYAIGSGGIWGKGLGESIQKMDFVPEAQNDMIFSIICEELGLFGGGAVIILFIMLLWRMMRIATNARDNFSALLVTGVMAQIAVQSILNIAVVTNTIPNTGVSLPFISYGGTSVVFLLAEMGIVFGVAGRILQKDMR